MSDITQNLLSTYYGFGNRNEYSKTLSIHESVNLLSDEANISTIDESLENEEEKLIKESSKGEDIIENCEDGFSTLDEKTMILDEEIFDKEDYLNEYVDIVESLCDENNCDILKTDDQSQEVYSEIEKSENIEIKNSRNKVFLGKINENKKLNENLNSYPEFSAKKLPSCDGIFFDLSGARISVLSEEMFIHFPHLKMLYLERNKLKKLPDEIFTSLQFLEWLDVRNNRLTSLPLTIKGHPNLETILMQKNKVERLPLELGTLPKMKNLQISQNPLIYPSREILSLGSAETLRYLSEEWNKIHPDESVKLVEDEILPKPSVILCYRPKTKNKKALKLGKKGSTVDKKLPGKALVRKRGWDYKPSNRCESFGTDESLEARLFLIQKAKEFLEKRAVELQKLIDKWTLKNWRYDHRSFAKSIAKASKRTEEDIPFAVDSNTISISMKQNQKQNSRTKLLLKQNRKLEKPIIDINKDIDEIIESLNNLKTSETTEGLTPKTEKEILKREMQQITDLQNSIKRLQKYNEIITAPPADKEIIEKTYNFPPSIII